MLSSNYIRVLTTLLYIRYARYEKRPAQIQYILNYMFSPDSDQQSSYMFVALIKSFSLLYDHTYAEDCISALSDKACSIIMEGHW